MSVRIGPMAESVRRWGGWPLILGAALGLGMASAPPKSFAERIGPIRPGPGRLVGFTYAPEGWKPSTEQRKVLKRESVLLDLELEKPQNRTVERLRQRAVLVLAEGKDREAVHLLEEAIERLPASEAKLEAALRSDLAAALGRNFDDPRAPTFALDAALAAAEGNPSLAEACFNRALALERLDLMTQAALAWEVCANREQDPRWKEETELHLSSLRQSPHPEDVEGPLTAETALAAALRSDLQAARIEALEHILPTWGAAFLAGRRREVLEVLGRGRAYGRILARWDREFTVARVFEQIAQDTRLPSGRTRLIALAQASGLYQEARNAIRAYQVDASERLSEQAQVLFNQARCPLGAWAGLNAIRSDFYRNDFETVLARLTALRPEVDEAQSPILSAEWHWIKGMVHSRKGDLVTSLSEFSSTAAEFGKTDEHENTGAGYQLVGEMYRLLGDEDEAWRYRLKALVFFRDIPASRRRLQLLRDSGQSLLSEGRSRSALAFLDEAVTVGLPSLNERDTAEILLWRAQALGQVGRVAEARFDLNEARQRVERVEDSNLRERTLADIGFAEADLEGRINPTQALSLFDEPARIYSKNGHTLPLATLLLHRARIARVLRKSDWEERDLQAGIKLFEQQWQSLTSEKDRIAFLEMAQELYDSQIVLEIERQDPVAALEYSEKARSFWTGSPGSVNAVWVHSLRVSPHEIGSCTAGRNQILPSNFVILEYALVENRIFIWVLRCSDMRYVATSATGFQVNTASRLLRSEAKHATQSTTSFQEISETVYDLLVRPVEEYIPAGTTIVFVPDKVLYGIPFSALRNRVSGRFLLEDHEVIVAPSATFFKNAWSYSAEPAVAGDALLVRPLSPDLRASGEELEDLRHLYPDAQVLAGKEALKSVFLEALGKHRLLHYAGHAEMNSAVLTSSSLRLSSIDDRETVTAMDLQGRSLGHLKLVVLSACGSVSASESRTGGFLGIARPFLAGGVRTVIGALWNVDDEASRSIMVSFHRELRAGRSPAGALRAAQLNQIARGKPLSTWSAFAALGAAESVEIIDSTVKEVIR